MAVFEISSAERKFASLQVIAPNVADAFDIVQRLNLSDADVAWDGAYAFSVRQEANGEWHLFDRKEIESDTPSVNPNFQ